MLLALGLGFALCRAVTSEGWQTQGNIPLGMLWLLAGLLAGSMALAASGLGVAALAQATGRLNRPP